MRKKIILAGEYNSGAGENSTISLKQHIQYVKRFMNFSFYGAIFWWWTYESDKSHSAFNLTNVVITGFNLVKTLNTLLNL